MIKPTDLGLSQTAWRPRQYDAFWDILTAEERAVAMVAPTGFGKSLVYVAAAIQAGWRVAFLTATKGLQDQLTDPIKGFDCLFDIRGRNNYVCLLDQSEKHRWAKRTHPLTVDEGICNFGQPCDLKADGCTYFDDYRRALKSQLVVTNYSYWLASHAYGDGLGKFDLLVCDEAHETADRLGDFLSVSVNWREMGDYGIEDPPDEPSAWADWAEPHVLRLYQEAERMSEGLGAFTTTRSTMREAKHVKELALRMAAIANLRGEWVLDKTDRGFRWDPVWARPYAEEFLFRAIPHVLLVSATIRPKTLGLLGLDQTASRFLEYPSSFPVSRRPIYVLPSVRLNFSSSAYDLQRWTRTIDAVVGARRDRKGIIDTVSYARRDYLLANSKNRDIFLTHSKENTAQVVEAFKADSRPRVLVSPSVGTGYDFPYKECEYIIISKVPYPPLGSKVVLARKKQDKEYMSYSAAQDIVQTSGRGMRALDDRCEVFIADENVKNIFRTHRRFFPNWWLDAVQFVKEIPRPAPKL